MTQEFVPHEGLIRASDVAAGAPLKQSEITRFINTIDTEVYQRDEAAPRKPDAPFKSKNLLDLAREASERIALEDAVRERAQKEAASEVKDSATNTPPERDASVTEPATASGETQLPEVQAAVSPTDRAEPDQPTVQSQDTQDADEVQAVAEPEETPAETPPAHSETSNLETESDGTFERLKSEAFEAGVLEGQRQARDEVEAMMSHALGLLEKTVQTFQEQGPDVSSALRDSISASVISLASSRAGMQIDQMPQAFWARIETLAERIQTSTAAPILKVHPSDLVVLQPCLEQSSKLLSLRLVADENLARGDIDLALEGIRLTDVMPRVEQPPTFVQYVPLTLADDVLDEPEACPPELSVEAESGDSQADGSYQSITDERIEEGSDDIKADEPEK